MINGKRKFRLFTNNFKDNYHHIQVVYGGLCFAREKNNNSIHFGIRGNSARQFGVNSISARSLKQQQPL
jgi:hypothetical protein